MKNSWTDLNIPKGLLEDCKNYKDLLDKMAKRKGLHDLDHASHEDRKEVFSDADEEYLKKHDKEIKVPSVKKYEVTEAQADLKDAVFQKAFEKNFTAVKNNLKNNLKGNQHKLDVDKDGEIESSDLKKLRNRKKENINEVSKETLKSYIKGAHKQSVDQAQLAGMHAMGTDVEKTKKHAEKSGKRYKYILKALDKLSK